MISCLSTLNKIEFYVMEAFRKFTKSFNLLQKMLMRTKVWYRGNSHPGFPRCERERVFQACRISPRGRCGNGAENERGKIN